jgi:hypothetical protein
MLLLGKPTGWPSVRLTLKEPDFFQEVRDYNPDNCSVEKINQIQMYTKAAQFKFEKLKHSSYVAAILCQWVLQIEAAVKARPAAVVAASDEGKQS